MDNQKLTAQTDTTLTTDERAVLDYARNRALDLAYDLEELADALYALAIGIGTADHARIVREHIDGAGALGVSRVADWEALLRGREVGV